MPSSNAADHRSSEPAEDVMELSPPRHRGRLTSSTRKPPKKEYTPPPTQPSLTSPAHKESGSSKTTSAAATRKSSRSTKPKTVTKFVAGGGTVQRPDPSVPPNVINVSSSEGEGSTAKKSQLSAEDLFTEGLEGEPNTSRKKKVVIKSSKYIEDSTGEDDTVYTPPPATPVKSKQSAPQRIKRPAQDVQPGISVSDSDSSEPLAQRRTKKARLLRNRSQPAPLMNVPDEGGDHSAPVQDDVAMLDADQSLDQSTNYATGHGDRSSVDHDHEVDQDKYDSDDSFINDEASDVDGGDGDEGELLSASDAEPDLQPSKQGHSSESSSKPVRNKGK
ncbi:hypothetical protein EST38_g3752, partial [Candolleomyces aberdarensis]